VLHRLQLHRLVGLGIALRSANAGDEKSIFHVLNIIYHEEGKRAIIRLNLLSLFSPSLRSELRC
jgi:hypothetical protein